MGRTAVKRPNFYVVEVLEYSNGVGPEVSVRWWAPGWLGTRYCLGDFTFILVKFAVGTAMLIRCSPPASSPRGDGSAQAKSRLGKPLDLRNRTTAVVEMFEKTRMGPQPDSCVIRLISNSRCEGLD